MNRKNGLTTLETCIMDVLAGLTIVVAALVALTTPINMAARWMYRTATSSSLAHRHS